MTKKIVKSETKSLSGLRAVQASYDARLKQIHKDYRSILKQVSKVEEFQKQTSALREGIAEMLRQEAENTPDKEAIAKKRQQKEMEVSKREVQLRKLKDVIVRSFGQKIINEVNALEADALKLGKDLKTLPSFIERGHLLAFTKVLTKHLLENFVSQEAWLRRLIGADSEGVARESEAQVKACIAQFKTDISDEPTKNTLLPYLARFENGTLSALTRFNKQKAEVDRLNDRLSKYVERASDEKGYRSVIDDPYGKYKDIPFSQLDSSLPKQQGMILAGILTALNQISSNSATPEKLYKAKLAVLEKVLDSHQSLGAWLRTNLIAKEKERFMEKDESYLAAQGNEIAQAKLLSGHMVDFLASPSCNEEFLCKNATEENKAEHLKWEQEQEYALLFKKSSNPFKEQADTYALKQVTKLYYAMVAAEAARIVLVEADRQAATVADTKDDKVAKEVRQGEVVVAQTDNNTVEQGYSKANYEPQRFFPNNISPTSSSPDEELLPSPKSGPQ